MGDDMVSLEKEKKRKGGGGDDGIHDRDSEGKWKNVNYRNQMIKPEHLGGNPFMFEDDENFV
jgi:hypothetical protein